MKAQFFTAKAAACTLGLLLAGTVIAQEATPGSEPGAASPDAPASAPQDPAIGKADRESGIAAQQPEGASIDEAGYTVADLMDKDVRNAQDEELGKVQNLLVSEDGRVTHAVVGSGGVLGVGQDMYAVPWDQLQFSPDQEHVVLNVGKDQLSTEFSAFEEGQLEGGTGQGSAESPAPGADPAQEPATDPEPAGQPQGIQ